MKLLTKMWHDERLKFIIFFILMLVISVAQILFWPTIQKLVPAFVENIPEPFKGLFGGMATQGFTYFVITQQFMKAVGFFGAFFTVILATSGLVKEIENRTMGLLLAQPISRTRVFLEKYLFGLMILAVTIIVSTILISPAAGIINESLDFWNTLLASVLGFLVLALLYSVMFTASLFLEDQMQAISLGLGFSFLMSLLVLFDQTKSFSIFAWLDPDVMLPILLNGSMPWGTCLIIIALSVVTAGIGLRKFERMNL